MGRVKRRRGWVTQIEGATCAKQGSEILVLEPSAVEFDSTAIQRRRQRWVNKAGSVARH